MKFFCRGIICICKFRLKRKALQIQNWTIICVFSPPNRLILKYLDTFSHSVKEDPQGFISEGTFLVYMRKFNGGKITSVAKSREQHRAMSKFLTGQGITSHLEH